MKVNYQNQNKCTALSKRPKSGDKDKFKTIMNNKHISKYKYASYFQSPNKGEDILFIKKKFPKMKKSSKDKYKNKTSNNNNCSNNNISSSYISLMSPINKHYYNKKQNTALTKFLKNQLILNSIDSSSFIKDKEHKETERVVSYNNTNLSNNLRISISKKLKSNNTNNTTNTNNTNNTHNTNVTGINHINNLKFNCIENNNIKNDSKNITNALSNSNIVINRIFSPTIFSNKKCTPESSFQSHNRLKSNKNSLNLNLNVQNINNANINKIKGNKNNTLNTTNNDISNDTKDNRIKKIKEPKRQNKEKDDKKINKKSYRFKIFNNINNNSHFGQNKLYSIKGIINNMNKKSYKNTSNQNILSNTVFEYNKYQHINNINFFESYVKAVTINKNNKFSKNKSISINKSNNFNNISNRKNNHSITFNSNGGISSVNTNTNRETHKNTTYVNNNKTNIPSIIIKSPKNSNISKTSKNSPKSSIINLNSTLNKVCKKLKNHIKNKSISILTKNDASVSYKNNNNNSNVNGSTNHNNKNKINYNKMNNTSSHTNGTNNNSNINHHYKYSMNLNKKLKLFDLENNNIKKSPNSPYNIYFKKKTMPNSNENTFINNNLNKNNKVNYNTNSNKINKTSNNSKSKNIYINKNYLSKHKHLSCLNNSTQFYFNHLAHHGESEISSPNPQNHQYQKTEDIIVNNYNININNQIHNTNTYFSGDIISVDNKKKNKNNFNNQISNNIPYKQSQKKKKIFSQSLKDILISNNKKVKNFTTTNSPINKLDILLNSSNNNNYYKNNENKIEFKIDSTNKFEYKKWSSNRDKIGKEIPKKKVFDLISSRKKEEKNDIINNLDSKNNNINENNNKNDNKNDYKEQKKSVDLNKKTIDEIEKNNKIKKASVKDIIINEFDNKNSINKDNNPDIIVSQYNPTISSRSSASYDANYYMKESLKLSNYIRNYYNRYKNYPNTSLQFYKYGRLIGQGAFGKVNLGLNILTGRIVAVKSFNKKNSELTGDNMKKIKYETDLMKKLNHPNITKVLEMFEDEKFFLIIMEYINGGNLFSFVKKRRKLSEKTAKFLFRQIILGIKYIHEQNIVHRDIKLENLLIDLNNNVKICDFGIGRRIESKNQLLFDQCGTLMYMAPEILLSTKEKGYEGFPVDIWSSGISLYIMLSGTLPFNYKNKKNENEEDNEEDEEESMSEKSKNKKKDEDNFELQYAIVYKEPKYIENISDEARDLLKGLLNKDPKKRLTCEEILNHPWLYNFKDKNKSSNKFHLFTKAEMIMLSKTFIDYRRANYEDLKENFTLSNIESDDGKNKKNLNEENATSKSSILAPYNSIISDFDNYSQKSSFKSEDSFSDFNNSKIKLEIDQIVFSKKMKEYNRQYELNNNGEVDNGVLINSKTQSSINMSDRSSESNTKNDIFDLNILNEKDEIDDFKLIKEEKKNNKNNNKNINEENEQKAKSNNILNQMSSLGYDKKYVLDCVKNNELCHASAVYYLMMNYENI